MSVYAAACTALFLLPLSSFAAPVQPEHLAPIRRAVDVGGRSANGGHIVAINSNTVDPNNRGTWLTKVLSANGITIDDDTTQSLKLKWSDNVFNGIAGKFSQDALNVLQKQKEVAWIEEDIEMHTTATLQTNAPWGIARLSSGTTSLGGGDPLALTFNYTFDDNAGAGTQAFIIDTGCRTSHQDFQGRAQFLATFGPGAPDEDRNGHGTHVAGTVGGSVFGVAKKATINCIKVMADDGSGATSDIISGINLAATEIASSNSPAVISMSLGGPISNAIDTAVAQVLAQGIPFVVAAGNESQDANNVSPARVPDAITVGATTIDDDFASFSNFGDAVVILAPGQEILSAGIQSDDDVAALDGTSMATPHISGLSLLLMAREGKQLSPADLTQRLLQFSVNDAIRNVRPGTTDALAFTGGENASA
jgi:cerevisin